MVALHDVKSHGGGDLSSVFDGNIVSYELEFQRGTLVSHCVVNELAGPAMEMRCLDNLGGECDVKVQIVVFVEMHVSWILRKSGAMLATQRLISTSEEASNVFMNLCGM